MGDDLGGLQRSLVREWWPDSEGPVRLFGSGQISGFLGVMLEIGRFGGRLEVRVAPGLEQLDKC